MRRAYRLECGSPVNSACGGFVIPAGRSEPISIEKHHQSESTGGSGGLDTDSPVLWYQHVTFNPFAPRIANFRYPHRARWMEITEQPFQLREIRGIPKFSTYPNGLRCAHDQLDAAKPMIILQHRQGHPIHPGLCLSHPTPLDSAR